jgi:pimeloyl-ACP methyl ester carboxylesterase
MVVRTHISIDVSDAVDRNVPLSVSATVVSPGEGAVLHRPVVVIAIPGGTYHRRYWDLQPPGRHGYSQAEHLATHGVVVVASDYLGGGDSSRPDDGDFIGLEVQADAAHGVFEFVRAALTDGTLADNLAPTSPAALVGMGQSLGGSITLIQQGRYGDHDAVGLFGTSALAANRRSASNWAHLSFEERRVAIMRENARRSGHETLPMYHGAPREQYRFVFHVPEVPDDLLAYDEEQCQTLIPRSAGVDALTPGVVSPYARRITTPVFLGFGETDVSTDPRLEPTAYPRSCDITTVVVPRMAHMHNFADTRMVLWRRFLQWLSVVSREGAG